MINQERILELFFDLVQIDSPSLKEKDVAAFLREQMEKRGYEVREDKAGELSGGNTGNLIVHIPATGEGEPIAFSAHMDCVQPCIGVEPIIDGDVVRSAGDTVLGSDDKAGIAMAIEALDHLKEESIPHPDIYFVFSICEEAGMHGAKNMDTDLLPVKDIIVLDSSGDVGTIVVAAPAKAGITMTFTGKSAHAGIAPEEGISAIQIAAEAVSNMSLLRIDESTTANLGHIEGGSVTNIVAASAKLTAEARSLHDESLNKQLEHMEACCAAAVKKIGGEYKFEYEISYPVLKVADDSAVLARVEKACENIGATPKRVPTGGGSDANILYGKGYNAVALGIGMSKVHTTEEFIKIESLTSCAELVAEIMKS
ncbi:M20/M25/M40 family metallo-hydrolase [Desulfovibrio sp. JC022]|uniref:M20/M25/M40 family metallo-hydrolase n=1 Tax=Desulfovibrio sp. JC022 TaxID=2593642 RepID=UPI0013D4B780|nr:M20/M25/M40 family metallo-hydrolase [Desulfovibrio sp. JC022]NDV24660.1 M20/M25/M40 family metallo-hydrolase [Desulfovibrio sp. JC022]